MKKLHYKSILMSAAAVAMMAGCAEPGSKTGTGAAVGALGGALVGAAVNGGRGAAIGAASGAVVGGAIGYNEEKKDREAEEAYYRDRRNYR